MTRSLWLADILADAFRGVRGFQVDEIPGWETRGRDGTSHVGVIDHHTGRGSYHALLEYMAYGSSIAPLCNIATSRPDNGTVRITVVNAGKANHAGRGWLPWTGRDRGNWHAIGIEHQNDGAQPWPDQQLEAAARIDAALLAHLQVDVSRLADHKTYAPGRKVDRHTIDLDRWRARVAAVDLRRDPMPTRHYAQAVVGWSATDIEQGRVLAAAYDVGLVRVEGGRLVSVTHPGWDASVGFAWRVGAAASRAPAGMFDDGVIDVAGADRTATAGQIARTLLDHPPDSISRRGRPW